MTTTISKTALTAVASGALALTLLLAGCTGSGDSSDEASGSARGGSSDTAEGPTTGELADFGSCEDVGTALSDFTEGLELQDTSTFEDGAVQCSWATPTAEAAEGNITAIVAVAQAQEFAADDITAQGDELASTEGVEESDDERAAAVDGRAFLQSASQTGFSVSGASVVTPHGLFAVTATGAGDTAPYTTEQTLDGAFALIG